MTSIKRELSLSHVMRVDSRLRDPLALVDVRVLDHLTVADSSVTSLAERGVP